MKKYWQWIALVAGFAAFDYLIYLLLGPIKAAGTVGVGIAVALGAALKWRYDHPSAKQIVPPKAKKPD